MNSLIRIEVRILDATADRFVNSARRLREAIENALKQKPQRDSVRAASGLFQIL